MNVKSTGLKTVNINIKIPKFCDAILSNTNEGYITGGIE
jgi:hypothetical protein